MDALKELDNNFQSMNIKKPIYNMVQCLNRKLILKISKEEKVNENQQIVSIVLNTLELKFIKK